MRYIVLVLFLLLSYLASNLVVGRSNFATNQTLKTELVSLKEDVIKLKEANRQLSMQIKNLRKDTKAVEELARADLGMIKKREVFYQIIS